MHPHRFPSKTIASSSMLCPSLRASLGVLLCIALSSLLAGCASSSAGSQAAVPEGGEGAIELIAQPFPTRAALEAILASPLPPFPQSIDAAFVPLWTMKGPVPDAPLGVENDDGIWTKVAREFSKTRGNLVLSPALRCAASETARFQLAEGKAPTNAVRDFITARCGWPHGLAASGRITAKTSKGTTDAAILAKLRQYIDETLVSMVPNRPGTFGLALERRDEAIVAVWAFGEAEVELDAPPTRDATGAVHLAGKLRRPFEHLGVLMNGEGFSVQRCTEEPAITPRFSFRCTGPSNDSEPRWLTLLGHEPGQIMGRALLNTLVHSGDEASLTWHAPAAPSTGPLSSATSIGEDVLQSLNELRAALGEKPVSLSLPQSALNAKLTPYLFAASISDRARSQEISLGVLAGWDVVGGPIRDALLDTIASHATTAGEWLAEALARPMGRVVLLDPRTEQVAIGGYQVPGKTLVATVISSYAFFNGADHPEIADALSARALSERRAHGLPDPQRIVGLAGIETALRQINQGGDLHEALMGALRDATTHTGLGMRGLVLRTIDPMITPLPPIIVGSKVPSFAVAVGHRATPGSAWGEYVVIWLWPAI